MSSGKAPSERHLEFHRRQWRLYLLYCGVMGMGTVVAVVIPGDNAEVVLGPVGVVAILMLASYLLMRFRDAKEFDREQRRIIQDEWFAASRHRALRDALQTVIYAQVPLVFFMSYVPPEPSVIGMAMMTTALGCGSFAGS